MNIAYISTIIPLAPDRSALLDVKNRVLLIAVARLLGRFEIELSVVLRLLSESDINIRRDPLSGNPCLAFADIPALLSVIRPPQRNDRHNRKHMSMLLEHAGLQIKMDGSGLIDQPRALSRELIFTLHPGGCPDERTLNDLYDFTKKVALR
jgi:hypothetical protein